MHLEVKPIRPGDRLRVRDSSLKDNVQVSDQSNPAGNGGWALLAELGSWREGKQVWLENYNLQWSLHLHGNVDSIILNARVAFVLGKLREEIYSQYNILVEPDPQKCSRLSLARQPHWSWATSLILVFCRPQWMNRRLTFLNHSANSNSILI